MREPDTILVILQFIPCMASFYAIINPSPVYQFHIFSVPSEQQKKISWVDYVMTVCLLLS
jgi:hypothetical protein